MGLLDAINVGLSGLRATQAGLDAAQNNVANINTPGYARRRVNLEEVVVSTDPRFTQPGGVAPTSVQSLRSAVLDARVAISEADVASADSRQQTLGELESLLSAGGVAELGTALGGFFGSFNELSARPEDPSLRAEAVSATGRLAQTISRTATRVASLAATTQTQLGERAARVNEISARIATTNRELSATTSDSQQSQALVDRQTELVRQIGVELSVRSYRDGDGLLQVSLANGDTLVNGDKSRTLTVDPVLTGGVSLEGRDVTADIGGGRMGGLLAARDNTIAPTLARLDDLATSLATTVNAQHALGVDGNGNAGGALFATGAATSPGTVARGFTAVLNDPSALALGATASPGDGVNAQALAGLSSRDSLQRSVGDLTSSIGRTVRTAREDFDTARLLREQAVSAREQLSGVSLDEEAADMIRYQRAFEASAKFLGTVNDLMATLINEVG